MVRLVVALARRLHFAFPTATQSCHGPVIEDEAGRVEVIKALPKFNWTQNSPDKAGCSDECAVCLVEYETGSELCRLPCKHCFHRECIERWLLDAQRLKKRACPTCKSNPLEVVEPAVHGPRSSTTTSAQSSNVNLNDQVAEDLTGPAGPGVALT